MARQGRVVRGVLNSSDVTTAAEISLYKDGSDGTADAVAAGEHLKVDQLLVVTAVGTDVHIFIGADGTPGSGETVLRGVFNAGGGASPIYGDHGPVGLKGGKPYVVADDAGEVNVILIGRIFGGLE